MVEFRDNNQAQESNTTPETITTSMIIADLENGIDRTGIKSKYNLETWEVKQMFEHPVLKGKKAKKIRKLSFSFVDDTVHTDVLPGQVDLEDAIKEELEGRQMMDAQDQTQAMAENTPEYTEDVDALEEKADDWANERQY